MYRQTRKYAERRKWHPRPDAAPEDRRPPTWQPPALRRRVTIEDFDGGEPQRNVIELFRTRRIDSYRAVTLHTEGPHHPGYVRGRMMVAPGPEFHQAPLRHND